MTNGFVQQHSRPSGTEDNFHLSCWGLASVELQDRLAGRFLGEKFGTLVTKEEVESDTASAATGSAGGIAVGFRDAAHIHAGKRLGVFGESAVRGDYKNVAKFVCIAGADFFDTRIVGT